MFSVAAAAFLAFPVPATYQTRPVPPIRMPLVAPPFAMPEKEETRVWNQLQVAERLAAELRLELKNNPEVAEKVETLRLYEDLVRALRERWERLNPDPLPRRPQRPRVD